MPFLLNLFLHLSFFFSFSVFLPPKLIRSAVCFPPFLLASYASEIKEGPIDQHHSLLHERNSVPSITLTQLRVSIASTVSFFMCPESSRLFFPSLFFYSSPEVLSCCQCWHDACLFLPPLPPLPHCLMNTWSEKGTRPPTNIRTYARTNRYRQLCR